MCSSDLVGDGLGVSVVIQETVCDDKRLLFAHDVFEFVKSDGQATLLHIDLLRHSEPKHVFSPLRNRFDVDKVLDSDVFGHGVSAPASATEREGRTEFEVVQIADTALRRGGVDEDAASFHSGCKLVEFCSLSHCVEINGGRMSVSAVCDKTFCFVKCVADIFWNILSLVTKYGMQEISAR